MRYLPFFCILLMCPGLKGQPSLSKEKDSTFIRCMLQEHNAFRSEEQLSPLGWSEELAADAKAWASHLAKSDKGDHDQSIRGREGENIWWGTTGAFTYTEMVDFWGNEKAAFVYGVFPDCNNGSGVVGHYTQIVWKNTTKVGCALATNGKKDYLVCRYSPAGNIIGQKPF
ncbi:CAP domain-containing protein [Flavitalea sp. BT771]|uniref:CAP domain-containing protein n=1 Tax=Flavitalea sp. BT771 TaxID=3063329 RepID=UPI0026E314BC|nr:CAP domain-containing protein [Flavitalea sp. BT771]MDO6432279.1 CAP domain-containing protein [Flavitalea sp. BT771]MDV6221189.1 CAP domain-containing protein [Flavitalea sp. BT771]